MIESGSTAGLVGQESMMDVQLVQEQARILGFDLCLEFDPGLLVPEERIRDYCVENRCGSYNVNHMCPPRIGSLHDIAARLDRFGQGVLLQCSRPLDVANDREGVTRTKLEFHRLLLRLERRLRRRGMTLVWGLMGGNCELCRICTAVEDKPCRHPERARTSLEAIGVDVVGLLERLGLDEKFHSDRITWTGCILFGEGEASG
jgi:predicted metal-binding protein